MRRVLLACLAIVVLAPASADEIPSPEQVFGHPVGADRKLVPYPRVLEYLEGVAAASDRVSIELAGTSTLGNPMPVLILTSEENQKRLDRIRSIGRALARPGDVPAERVPALIDEGRAVALVTCTIHSTEVACTQMAMELVHEFATTDDPERTGWMDEAVLLLMPSINPDGQVMIVDWYEKWLGTEYEGGRMPWLYHHYVGHDDNRDFYMLTQKETRVVNDLLYHRWFPQVFLDEHQMGSTGPRMFVPPQTDPLDEQIHSLVFRQADLLGTNMSRRLEEAGKRGVGHDMIFDSYWPGGTRNTAWWKNVTGLLTEVASARLATPVWIDPTDLRGGFKGLPDYVRRSNYPSPWDGGWWRLRDIVEYEKIATWAFLETLAENRRDILRNMDRMSRDAIARGENGAPHGWILHPEQRDPVAAGRLVELLLRHGIEVERAVTPARSGLATLPPGTTVIPAAQPYRPFLLTMLRPQRYPEVRSSRDGSIFRPYDVTSWSLPISMGVRVVEVDEPLVGVFETIDAYAWPEAAPDPEAAGWILPHAADTVYTAMNHLLQDGRPVRWLATPHGGGERGDVWVSAEDVDAAELERLANELNLPVISAPDAPQDRGYAVSAARVGLFKPWVASMDEGWTRWLLERYGFPFVNLSNDDIRSGRFTDDVDVLLFPDVGPGVIARGEPVGEDRRRFWTPLPPEYSGGIDTAPAVDGSKRKGGILPTTGGKRIREWVRAGGTVVALDSSTEYVIDLFELPVQNVLADATRKSFDCPGSMLRILVDTDHPLAFGLREEEAAYFARSPAFRTRLPDPRFERRVIARYPDDDKDILISGYLAGSELLEKRVAVVEYGVGEGRVVLIGFRAQHRAQPLRTFKLLFNTLYELQGP